MSSERRTVSASGELFERAEARQRQLCYSSFSDYIQALIRADVLKEQASFHDAAPPEYKPQPTAKPVSYKPKKGNQP